MTDTFNVTIARRLPDDPLCAEGVFGTPNLGEALSAVWALSRVAPEATYSVWHWPPRGPSRRIVIIQRGRWRVGVDLDARRAIATGLARASAADTPIQEGLR